MGCEGIWWDVISVPSKANKDDYRTALNNMHKNYEKAQVTLVHNAYLLNIPWSDDGLPCIALVLSTWFTRGWTALELARSERIKVLFKDNVLKDLDEILAESPAHASRAHWLATAWIKRLREPVNDIGDILGILSTRKTETLGDRPIIAGLLADVPGFDMKRGEADITKQILGYLGHVPQSCLLHGQATMADSGGFSWCAASLDDMPIPIPSSMESREVSEEISMLDIDYTGAIEGLWLCRSIGPDQRDDPIQPYGSNLSSSVKITVALGSRERCLLLRPLTGNKEDKALLVQPTKVDEKGRTLECRYIGSVLDELNSDTNEWHLINISFGRHDKLEDGSLENVMDQVHQDERKICKYCLLKDVEIDEDEQANGEEENGAVSSREMAWLENGTEYTPLEPVEILSETSFEIPTLQELQRAVAGEKHRAVHHIVSMIARDEVALSKEDVQSTIHQAHQDLGEDKAHQAKQVLWSLGDALVYHTKLDEAALAYEAALTEYPAQSFVGAIATYNLGMVNAMLGDYECAKTHFETVLKAHEEHAESEDLLVKRAARNHPKRMKKKNLNRGKGSKKSEQPSGTSADNLEDWELAEEGWTAVWWSTTAALILLCSRDDDEWIEMFFGAFDIILKIGEDNTNSKEVFSKESEEDGQIDPSSDELLERLYKALRKFNFIFRRDHPLVFITSRLIGIQLMGHASWYEAKNESAGARVCWKHAQEHLERARLGLSGFGFLWFWEKNTESQNWWIADTDRILIEIDEKLQG